MTDDIIRLLEETIAFNERPIENIDSCKKKVTEFFDNVIGQVVDTTSTLASKAKEEGNEIAQHIIEALGDNIAMELVVLFKGTHSVLRDAEGKIIENQATVILNLPNYLNNKEK